MNHVQVIAMMALCLLRAFHLIIVPSSDAAVIIFRSTEWDMNGCRVSTQGMQHIRQMMISQSCR